MGLTKTSWIGVFILVSVPIFFLSFYFIGIITNVISTIEQVLVAVFAVMIISGVALIYKGWKPSSKNETNKPNFDHIQAWFFYPKKYSWGKGERDPKKHVPRQKVVLVTDSKKAYFMGKYAIDLVLNEKVRWFSDDKQENLGEWCKNKGYELMHEIGTEDLLLEAYFHAEIKDKKEKYRRGDIVIFETYYRGKLKNGFFDNKILYPEGKKFRRGRFKRKKNHHYSWSTDTLNKGAKWIFINLFFKGKLNGYRKHNFEWSWGIHDNAPKGEYRIFMCVYNWNGKQTTIRQKEETIFVV